MQRNDSLTELVEPLVCEANLGVSVTDMTDEELFTALRLETAKDVINQDPVALARLGMSAIERASFDEMPNLKALAINSLNRRLNNETTKLF